MEKDLSRRAVLTSIAGAGLIAVLPHDAVAADTIAQRVIRMIAKHLGIDQRKVTENARFIEDLGADSLDMAELLLASEEEFSIEIPDEVANAVLTVGDAVNLIGKLTAHK